MMKKVMFFMGMAILIALSAVLMPTAYAGITAGGLSLMTLPIVGKIDRNGVIIELGRVSAVAIYDQFEKAHVAHVKQDVVSKYPSKKFSNRLSGGLFTSEDAGTTDYTTTRHTLVKIPNELVSGDDKSLKIVQKQLDSLTGTIQRITSHNLKDVLTEGDDWAIEQGHTTIEELSDKYETRDTENNKYSKGQLRMTAEGEVINALLPKEYSRRVYQPKFVADVDLRGGDVVANEQTSDMGTEVLEASGTLKA